MDRVSEESSKGQLPSFGGDVADFLGTLEEKETNEPYEHSMNPNGNPFQDKSVGEMLNTFTSTHPNPEDLKILRERLDNFYGVNSEKGRPDTLPKTYTETISAIETYTQKNK